MKASPLLSPKPESSTWNPVPLLLPLSYLMRPHYNFLWFWALCFIPCPLPGFSILLILPRRGTNSLTSVQVLLWQNSAGQRWLEQKCRHVNQKVSIYFLDYFCFFASCSPYNVWEAVRTFLAAQPNSEDKTGVLSRHKLEHWRQSSPLGQVLGRSLRVFVFLLEASFWPFPNPKCLPKGTQEGKSVLWWVRWGDVTEPPSSLKRPTSSAYPCDKFREIAGSSTPAAGRPEGWAGHIQDGGGGWVGSSVHGGSPKLQPPDQPVQL